MDQEQLAAGDAAIPGHQAQGLREINDFVTEGAAAAAGTTEVSGARFEDQRPRQSSVANSELRSGMVRTGATTASVAAARARQHEQAGQASLIEGCTDDDEDVKDKDVREFDDYIKMQLQLQQTRTQQLTHPLPPRRRAAVAAPAPASQPLNRRHQRPPPSSTEGGGGGEVAPAAASHHLDLELRL